MHRSINLTEFILEEEKNHPKAKGNFTLLLMQLEYAGKVIASHIRKAGLADMMGTTGTVNASQDEVIKIDQYSNQLLIDTLSASGQVHALASEELEDIHYVEKENGEYVVFFDPLDGSSNTEINVTVGTIFSVYHKAENVLQPGNRQVAAGYILYGTSVMFVYSSGNGVHGFTLDPSVGSFLLSHPNMRIPEKGFTYSINEGNYSYYDQQTKAYINSLKETGEYKLRYFGSMVTDVHRTLLKGGIFMYPRDEKNKEGKLRLLFEVNPMSYLFKQAGGIAITDGGDPLDIVPNSPHQRAPIVLGSPENVKEYLKYLHS
ncbi:MAG TPA: class 1 fructose-bisphosphatase [Patescibacteria group bacterium]|nr:class 1 fructose-bisphosphatase [Patescibacteria group bacterium]